MDYRSLLTDLPSAAKRDLIVREVGFSEAKFLVLLDLAFNEKDPLAWRATWVVDGCDEVHTGLASAHITTIIQKLPDLDSM